MRVRPQAKSLFSSIALALVVGLLLPALLVGGLLMGWREPQTARETLAGELQARLDGLARSLPELLWNLDHRATRDLVASAMHAPDVVRVQVIDQSSPDPLVQMSEPTRRLGRSLVAERAVVRGSQVIGHVVMEMDDHRLTQAIARQRWLYAFTVGGQLLVSLALLLALVHKRLIQPLRRLGRFAADIAGGRLDAAAPLGRDDEIGRLGQSMERMRAALQSQFERERSATAELERHRHHLEELVAARTVELADASQAAQAASRAKSAFLANMSHEIRTPLNAILGQTQLLHLDQADAGVRKRLSQVESAARHLLTIVNQVLDLSKIEAGKLQLHEQPFVLGELLDQVLAMVAPQAQAKGLQLQLELPAPLRTQAFFGDSARITEVLLNFAGNAVKFSEHGSIVLRLQARPSAQGGGTQLRFEVHDSGVGIAADELPRLFEEFEQGDDSRTRRHGGTGLGLAISRRLAQAMAGEVGARSTPGLGSVFWFELVLPPVTAPQALPAADHRVPAAPIAAPGFDGQQVLVAEDNPVNQEIASAMLQRLGLRVVLAGNGAEALERVRALDPALVLMDVNMPLLDGLSATRELRRSGWRGPIVAMTASAFADERQACLDSGMDDHLTKPVDMQALQQTLARWIGTTHALST